MLTTRCAAAIWLATRASGTSSARATATRVATPPRSSSSRSNVTSWLAGIAPRGWRAHPAGMAYLGRARTVPGRPLAATTPFVLTGGRGEAAPQATATAVRLKARAPLVDVAVITDQDHQAASLPGHGQDVQQPVDRVCRPRPPAAFVEGVVHRVDH